LRRLADDSDRRAAGLHHQANLVMPLPVIGSVLLDDGQALRDTARKQKGFIGVKKDFLAM
jgi:hypothetical protein